MLAEETLVRWSESTPGAKPLGIVLAPVTEDMAHVLMADERGSLDVEVFVARPEATGVNAAALILESMEPANESVAPAVAQFLRIIGPNWSHVSAHLDGAHSEQPDPDCIVCADEASGQRS